MTPRKSLIFLLSLFIITNTLGLMAAQNLQQMEGIQETREQNKSAASGVYFFALIGISTVLMLVLYKYKADVVVKGWFVLALFMTSVLFFDAFFVSYIALLLAGAAVFARFQTNNFYILNALTIFSFAGAGAFFGSIIGFKAAVTLFVVLSLYDYFSVNISEHMISLAKSGVETNTFMGFAYPKEEGGIDVSDMEDIDLDQEASEDVPEEQKAGLGILGGGDVVVPLAFAAAAMATYGIIPAIVSVFGAAAGLGFLLVKAQQGKFYPAIPPVAIGSMAGFGIAWGILNMVLPAL